MVEPVCLPSHIPLSTDLIWSKREIKKAQEVVILYEGFSGLIKFVYDWGIYLVEMLFSFCNTTHEMPRWKYSIQVFVLEEKFLFNGMSPSFGRVWDYAHAIVGKSASLPCKRVWEPMFVTVKTTFKDLIPVKCELDEGRFPGEFTSSALGQISCLREEKVQRSLFPITLVKEEQKPLLKRSLRVGLLITGAIGDLQLERVAMGAIEEMGIRRGKDRDEGTKIVQKIICALTRQEEGRDALSQFGVIKISAHPARNQGSVSISIEQRAGVEFCLGDLSERLKSPLEDFTELTGLPRLRQLCDEVNKTMKYRIRPGLLISSNGKQFRLHLEKNG